MSEMSKFKRIARIAAGAILATGIFAGSVAPASAATHDGNSTSAHMTTLDTGWGV
jgi:hypothetical protein